MGGYGIGWEGNNGVYWCGKLIVEWEFRDVLEGRGGRCLDGGGVLWVVGEEFMCGGEWVDIYVEDRFSYYRIIKECKQLDLNKRFNRLDFADSSLCMENYYVVPGLQETILGRAGYDPENEEVKSGTGDWAVAERLFFLHGECNQLGFDTVELNTRLLQLREDTLLRYIRLIKSKGLKARLQFDVKLNHVDIPPTHEREHVVYVFPTNPTSGMSLLLTNKFLLLGS
ncbi:protein heat-stress-associated 32 [Tanacetum coccineum]